MISWRLACELQIAYSREVDAQVAQRRVLYNILAVAKGGEGGSLAWGATPGA
jgi:hypothetical protein